ncbi:MAG: thiamine diphosphokinase [Clostridia bacterium]|nr:thiamine diphosphokinase [Clostridia bacterium]
MRALIVLGGDKPGAALLGGCMKNSDLVIAADSGLAAFDEAGLAPDWLVGDMDSVSAQIRERYNGRVKERRLNCIKDDTDGVDALDMAMDAGATEITLLGALGGRLDHAMANLMLLVRAHGRGVRAEILSEAVRIIRVDERAVLTRAKGDTVSLVPLGEARGVTLRGFFYPLTEHTLRSDYPLGVSNVVTQEEAVVLVREGDLILFHYIQGV